MEIERFTVQNVKCGGCVSAIQTGLQQLAGISDVEVLIEGGQVSVHGADLQRDIIAAKLKELGYPEA